jgi:hypothetical protein
MKLKVHIGNRRQESKLYQSCLLLCYTRERYLQKWKLIIDGAVRKCRHVQLIENFLWTPDWRAAYSHLPSNHRAVRVGLRTYIELAARNGPIPVITACSHGYYRRTVHTITTSPLYNHVGKSFGLTVTEICLGHYRGTTICYWYYRRDTAHYGFITVSYGI